MTGHRFLSIALVALPLVALAGCEAMSQPFPEKEFFAIEVGVPDAPAGKAKAVTVRVRRFRVADPYDGRSFVYRVGSARYKTDYYNGFIASPDHLLTGQLVEWLAESGLFSTVMASTAEGEHDFVLDGSVTELCGDYSQADSPKAVVEVRMFLLDDSQVNTRVVFQKKYSKEASLADKTPEALAAGLGEAYRKVLANLTADLAKVQPQPAARPTATKTLP